jgi:hypothetical protein
MTQRLEWNDLPLARLSMPKGTMALIKSLASGLSRSVADAPDIFWGVGDRGPNIKPGDAIERYGLDELSPLAHVEGAKIMPLPETGPSLARFRLVGDRVEFDEVIPLRAPDGVPLTGMPPSALPGMESEPVFALDGKPLGTASNGADTEGVAALPDGRFWIAEEYGPSLLLVGRDGVVQRRLVPNGASLMFSDASIPVDDVLPALALARKLNRGFEALDVSPDGATLCLAFQSPLAHPDRAAHDNGDIVRIWTLDAVTGTLQAQFAYPLDPPKSFLRDSAVGPVGPSDVKVSELTSLPDGSLLVLERISLSTHIYRVRLDVEAALPVCFIDPDYRPTLEQVGRVNAESAGIRLLAKELVLSTDQQSEICGDLEGMLVLNDGSLLLVNDSDYGIEGAETQFWRVNMPELDIMSA